jgi:hypothetical protein
MALLCVTPSVTPCAGRTTVVARARRTPRSSSGCHPRSGHGGSGHAGGVDPNLARSVSGRFLSFAEREDIAVWHAQSLGVREIAPRLGRSPSTISRELWRNAPPGRGGSSIGPRRRNGTPSAGRAAPRRRSWSPTSVSASTCSIVSRRDPISRRNPAARTGCPLERAEQASASRSAVGDVLEPGADREPAAGRFPR